jgi:uncharacterized integral membrane protein (TIGR00697 family)
VIANVAAVKLIGLGELHLGGWDVPVTIDGGAIVFPLTYILGDLIAEVFGFKAARRAIWLGLAGSAAGAGTFVVVQLLPAAANWHGGAAYMEILGFVPRVVIASLAGYLAGQMLNAFTLTALKRKTRGRALWARLIGSTVLGEAADTLVFCCIAFLGVITGAQFIGYVLLGYLYKCLIEVILLPVTYKAVSAVRRHEERLSA